MSNDIAVYRAPAEHLSLTATLVPEISTRRCRWFGHQLKGRIPLKQSELRWEWDAEQQTHVQSNSRILNFPSSKYPSSLFTHVWCIRCGREWRHNEKPSIQE